MLSILLLNTVSYIHSASVKRKNHSNKYIIQQSQLHVFFAIVCYNKIKFSSGTTTINLGKENLVMD